MNFIPIWQIHRDSGTSTCESTINQCSNQLTPRQHTMKHMILKTYMNKSKIAAWIRLEVFFLSRLIWIKYSVVGLFECYSMVSNKKQFQEDSPIGNSKLFNSFRYKLEKMISNAWLDFENKNSAKRIAYIVCIKLICNSYAKKKQYIFSIFVHKLVFVGRSHLT